MGEAPKKRRSKEGSAERGSRFFRDINAVGALALGGAAIVAPPLTAPLWALAGLNAAQAGGFEVARRIAKKRRLKREGEEK
jgi:hypothetical protein